MLPKLLQRNTSRLTRSASSTHAFTSRTIATRSNVSSRACTINHPMNRTRRHQLHLRVLTQQPCTPSIMLLNMNKRHISAAPTLHPDQRHTHKFEPLTEFPLIDELLEPYRELLGEQMEAYKNHLKRVINFALLLHPYYTQDELKRLQIAAVFHDIGLWTAPTMSHLAPSCEEATKYLTANELETWSDGQIECMILDHHNFTPSEVALAEVFRKSDWIDISFGIRRFGLKKEDIQLIIETFPNLDFHANPKRMALLFAHMLAVCGLTSGAYIAYKKNKC